MEYHVISLDKKSYELDKIYETKEQAEKRLIKQSKKNDKKHYKIIEIPEIKAGLKLFKSGIYYRTILRETKCLWELNCVDNMMHYSDYMLKENIYKYFYLGIYDEGIESYDNEFIDNFYIPEEEIAVNFEDNEDEDYQENVEDESEEFE